MYFLMLKKFWHYFSIDGKMLGPKNDIGVLLVDFMSKRGLKVEIFDPLKPIFVDRHQTRVCLAGLGANSCALM